MPLPFALIPAAVSLAAEFFPDLVTKIGGRHASDVARRVVQTAARVASLPPDASVEQIAERIRTDDVVRGQLEIEFARLDQEEYRQEIEERASARVYQVKIGAEGRKRGNIMLIGVSAALTSCVLVVIWPWRTTPIGQGELALVTTIAGALLKMFSDAFAFEFGSSRGSKEKDAQIAEFQAAMEKASQGRADISRDVIQAQERRLDKAQQAVITTAKIAVAQPADITIIDTGNAPGAARDFVAQLIAGKI